MINNINKYLSIITEDYWYDREIRRSALELWKRIISDLYNTKTYLEDISIENGIIYKLYQDDLGNDINVGFTLKYFGTERVYSNKGFFTENNNRIVIVFHNELLDNNLNYINSSAMDVYRMVAPEIRRGSKFYSDIFVYEYTHFINQIMRYKNPELANKGYKKYGSVHKGREVSYQDYIRQGIEINAFIQKLLAEIDGGLSLLSYKTKLNWLDSFTKFKEFVTHTNTYKGQLQLIHNEYPEFKKINKKLYDYYLNKKREVDLSLNNEYMFEKVVRNSLKGYSSDNFKMGIKARGGAKMAVVSYARSNKEDYWLVYDLTEKDGELYNSSRDEFLKKLLKDIYPDLSDEIEADYD
jgi:hypothetical protein